MARPKRFELLTPRFVVCFFRPETIAYLVSNDLHGLRPFERLMPADHRKAGISSLSSETLPFFDTCVNLANGIAQEAGKRRLPGVAVKSVSGLFEFDTVE